MDASASDNADVLELVKRNCTTDTGCEERKLEYTNGSSVRCLSNNEDIGHPRGYLVNSTAPSVRTTKKQQEKDMKILAKSMKFCILYKELTSPEEMPTYAVTVKDMKLQKFHEITTKMQADLSEFFSLQLQDRVAKFVEEIEQVEWSTSPLNKCFLSRQKSDREVHGKEFSARQSILSDLLEISHIRTIYHIFIAILIVFMLNTLVCDAVQHGRINLDFQLIVWTFGKFSTVVMIWMYMTLSTTVVLFPLFQLWALNRRPGSAYWLDYICLVSFVVYQLAFITISLNMLLEHQLPPASSVIVLAEQTRMVMKAHSFVRENAPRAIAYHELKGDGNGRMLCPDFSQYLYFLFAPTLIYRDSYPRNQGPVRWNYVVSNFFQVLASLFYAYYIFERFCCPVFRSFSHEYVVLDRLIVSVFGCMLPGTLMLFIGFFAILHSWMNAFAEMLRFADRLFYKDWWNSASFANYYRTWNVIVHDWLYTYIYKDIHELLLRRTQKALSMAAVFLVSALFHEYIIAMSFGFWYPVLFVMFAGAGFAFIFLPSRSERSGNVFMWVTLFIGMGVLMCLYSMEWYARTTCKQTVESHLDYLIPRMWKCTQSAAE